MNEPNYIRYNRAFGITICLNVGFVVFEAVFGILANSTALIADAGHNLGDVLGLLLAWGAQVLSTRRPSRHRTYGWKSSTIMAALINAIILFAAALGISWEAVYRFGHPPACFRGRHDLCGCLRRSYQYDHGASFCCGSQKDLNIRGAFLHMAADAGV